MDPLLVYNNQVLESEHWTKPIENMIKVNVDGSIFEAENCFGFGFLARDSQGRLIEGISKSLPGRVSPEIAEIFGIKEALSWIKFNNWQEVTLETDCLVAVQAISSGVNMPSSFGLLVEECRQVLCDLVFTNIQFVRRSANKAAHFLACSACSLSDRVFYSNNCPSELLRIVLADSLN
uniref:RNase H type-1 domain-containing protein n=1 Tax=Cannabis sativa TaxID=3483 RepID=A0A803PRY9_CANSA